MAIKKSDYVAIGEAATFLAVSERTVRRLIEDGAITASRVRGQYRIARDELRGYMERTEQ